MTDRPTPTTTAMPGRSIIMRVRMPQAHFQMVFDAARASGINPSAFARSAMGEKARAVLATAKRRPAHGFRIG